MKSLTPKESKSPRKTVFHRVAENLYRSDTSGWYYGAIKRGDKKIKRALVTKDRKFTEFRFDEQQGCDWQPRSRPIHQQTHQRNSLIQTDLHAAAVGGSQRRRSVEGLDFLTYKAVAATTQLSDGEEGFLPVLSKRILVTESLPLPIRGKETKQFRFEKLLASGQSDTLRHQSLTVQMTSQPAWYAVMALPYLMEYPYECIEQIFNRLYANVLARHIANSDPKIRRVFDL
jgi:hypothetical protein